MNDGTPTPKPSTQVVPVRIKFDGAKAFAKAYTQNLDLEGIFVPTSINVPLGTQVHLTVEVSAGKGFQVFCEVAWQREASDTEQAGVGLRFKDLHPKHKQWLERVVAQYLRDAGLDPTTDSGHALRQAAGVDFLTDNTFDMGGVGFDEAEGPVLGIDLGTSNSCACVYWGGEYIMLGMGESDTDLSRTIPSVVSYDDRGHSKVGSLALTDVEKNPKRTVYGAKRFIGRNYAHPDVQGMLSRYPYRIVPTPHQRVAVEINGQPIDLIEVSAKILDYIRTKAQKRLRQPVQRAVITVPACYNQNQRAAVVEAGRRSGLTVERIVNEPTAAAIAYGLTYNKTQCLLVYDLGGGTFDVSVMEATKKKLSVLATAGDTFLGGEDFDGLILDFVCAKFQENTGTALSRNSSAIAPIKVAVERAKCRLSLHEKSMVMVRDVVCLDGSKARLEVALTRNDAERLVAPLVKRTLAICDLALKAAGVDIKNIADVIMVGGQTLMPYVRLQVENHFGRRPRWDLPPDEVVARGAGMLTHLASDADAVAFSDALPVSIGIAKDGQFVNLIAANTQVPHEMHYDLVVAANELHGYAIDVYQGEASEVIRNELLGTIRLRDMKPGENPMVPLAITFALTSGCMLNVSIRNPETGQEIDILLDTSGS